MHVAGKRYDTGEPVAVEIIGDRVSAIARCGPGDDMPLMAPGLVDLQVNGYGGQEFNDLDLTVDKIVRVSLAMDADGVTSYLPTATTHSSEMLESTMRVLSAALSQSREVSHRVPGFHLEGPYISPEDGPRGAHPLEHCRAPDWDEFRRLQDAANGHIRILTMAPELEGAANFIEKVVASGVLVAIGHTAADPEQIGAAVDAGARMSTHLGNGAHGQIRRHPNYIWEQLADDRLTASLIADGHHLPSSVVKCFVRAKGKQRCVLVSDLVGMAGMPAGRHRNTSIGDVEILDDGRIVVAGQRQYLAGAGLPITHGIANITRFAEVDIAEAIDMASTRPAKLIGLEPGAIEPGAIANLVLFHIHDTGPVEIVATINHGQLVHGSI